MHSNNEHCHQSRIIISFEGPCSESRIIMRSHAGLISFEGLCSESRIIISFEGPCSESISTLKKASAPRLWLGPRLRIRIEVNIHDKCHICNMSISDVRRLERNGHLGG